MEWVDSGRGGRKVGRGMKGGRREGKVEEEG